MRTQVGHAQANHSSEKNGRQYRDGKLEPKCGESQERLARIGLVCFMDDQDGFAREKGGSR